jgi:hypothetical protein
MEILLHGCGDLGLKRGQTERRLDSRVTRFARFSATPQLLGFLGIPSHLRANTKESNALLPHVNRCALLRLLVSLDLHSSVASTNSVGAVSLSPLRTIA